MVDYAVGFKGPLRVEFFQRNDIGRRFYERYCFGDRDEFLHEASGEVTLRLSMPSR